MSDVNVNIPRSAINDVYLPYLDNQTRVQIYFGGSSSGKSRFIIGQRVVYQLLQGGRNFLICRQTKTSIRGSVAMEIAKVIDEWGLSDLFTVNKTDGTVTCRTGYQAAFAGLDDVEKLKSITYKKGVLTDVVVEEATETEQKSIKQLMKRQRGKVQEGIKKTITLLFNPILKQHWIFKEYFERIGWTETQKEYHNDRISILKTTYKDNRFLEPDDIADLENETDEYFYQVYTLGNFGVLGDVIFKNWRVEDLSGMADQFTNRRNGLDFGFSSDPAAALVSHYDRMRKTIYIYRELYETGLTNNVIADRMKNENFIGRYKWRDTGKLDKDNKPILEWVFDCTDRLTCDSAEPKSIQELKNYNVDAVGARKGKDSIRQGIDWLRQQTIIVDASCINMQNELSQYHWKKDAGGNSLPVPVDKNNHLIDALRYAYESDMLPIGDIEIVENPFFQ